MAIIITTIKEITTIITAEITTTTIIIGIAMKEASTVEEAMKEKEKNVEGIIKIIIKACSNNSNSK